MADITLENDTPQNITELEIWLKGLLRLMVNEKFKVIEERMDAIEKEIAMIKATVARNEDRFTLYGFSGGKV